MVFKTKRYRAIDFKKHPLYYFENKHQQTITINNNNNNNNYEKEANINTDQDNEIKSSFDDYENENILNQKDRNDDELLLLRMNGNKFCMNENAQSEKYFMLKKKKEMIELESKIEILDTFQIK